MKISLFIAFVCLSLTLAVCCCSEDKSTSPSTKKPDFTIEVSPESQSVTAGDSAEFKIKLTSLDGFSAVCTLSAVGYSQEDSAAFDAEAVVPTDSSRLTIFTNSSTPQETYEVVVIGKTGKVSHSDTVSLSVPGQQVTDYYPLAVGNSWKYALLDHTGKTWMTFFVSIVDTMTVNGNFGYLFDDLGFLYVKADTIFTGSGDIILAGPLVVGQSWISGFYTYELIEFGSVTLTSGTEYHDCAKIEKTRPDSPGEVSYEWWARGVGQVKMEEYLSGLLQGSKELEVFIHD
jgi:hypothetical protein